MTENMRDSILGNSGLNVEAAKRQGKAVFEQGMDAARQGVRAAREGMEYAQDHVGDGVDLVKTWANSLSEFVSGQPLVAVAGAFLIGYLAARMLRRAPS